MSSLSISESSQLEFSKLADGIELSYQAVEVGTAEAHVFFVNYKDGSLVASTWRKAANFIAIHYQTKIESEFGRWNSYLFLCVSESLPLDIKYQIENDTFSTRKIVIENDISGEEIINRHILNRDLQVTITSTQELQNFASDKLLWTMLEGKVLKIKKRTGAAEETFNELFEALKTNGDEV